MELKKPHQREINQFYQAFHEDFEPHETPPPFANIFRDEECWEQCALGPKLKRPMVLQKMVEPRIWNGECYLQEDFKRFQLACWCCLEEDVIALLDHFKEKFNNHNNDEDSLKTLMNSIMGLKNGDQVGDEKDKMLEYWCYFATGNDSSLELNGRHPYVYGMDAALSTGRVRVEAVEYFWKKILNLPESKLPEKRRLLFHSAVKAACLTKHPEVFEFCFSQIHTNSHGEFVELYYKSKGNPGVLLMLLKTHHLDVFQRFFDDLGPDKIKHEDYIAQLQSTAELSRIDTEPYTRIFMHLWTKEGFDRHRTSVVTSIIFNDNFAGSILYHLILGKNLEPFWAVLDKFSTVEIQMFMERAGVDVRRCLKKFGDKASLDKFLSYK